MLAAAAEKMFADTNSPWTRLPWKDSYYGGELFDPELLVVPAFRVMLAREMEKTNDFGTVSWGANSMLGYQNTNSSGGYTVTFPPNESPTNGASDPIRWCDWIALSLARHKQVPFFNPFEPVKKRDEAIKADQERLGAK